MSQTVNYVYDTLDDVHKDKPAATRRQMIAGASAVLGSMGMLAWADNAEAQTSFGVPPNTEEPNTPQTILNAAATVEVLATIVNTQGLSEPNVNLTFGQRRNVRAAAFEEKIHYELLTSDAVGGIPATKRIWVPDLVFRSTNDFFTVLAVGDQVFINAYLLATTVFARFGTTTGSRFARFAAEFMGAEAVHRALALEVLGGTGADRAFMRFSGIEERPGLPTTGEPGFTRIDQAVVQLQKAGFGFGEMGASPGKFYEYDEVSARTPEPGFVNTRAPS